MRIRCLLVLAIGVGLGGGCPLVGRDQGLPELPQVDVADFLPAIRRQVEQAYAAVRRSPTDPAQNGSLGMVLDAYEQYASAAVCYQRAHLLDPSSFRWTYYLGVVEVREGEYREAMESLRVALKMRPDYLPARFKLAESLLAEGKFEESGRLFEGILKNHPDVAAAHYGLGRVEAAVGNPAVAVKSYRVACELFPQYGMAHYALGLAYRKLGESAQAEQHFKIYQANKTDLPPLDDPLLAAVQELNHGPAAHLRHAVALEQAGKIEEAARELDKAVEIDPQDVQSHISLISLYGRLGKFDKAEQQYRIAVSLNPNRADCYYDYGVIRLTQHKDSEAEEAFRHALHINPYYAEAHINLGVILEQQGRLDEALKHFEEAIANRPNAPLAHFHAGRILVNQGKYGKAIQHFVRTLTPQDENTPRYLYALGATYARTGDRINALQYLLKAREEATARGQTQLAASIDRDLRNLEQTGHQP